LAGINTPEIHGVKKESTEYKAGIISKEWLEDRLNCYPGTDGIEVTVRTHKDKKGKYGRYLVEIFDGEDSINDEMVEKGLAVAYDGGKR